MEAPQIMIHHHDPYGTVVEFFLNPEAMEKIGKAAHNAEIIACDFDICNMSFKICFKNKESVENGRN